MTTVRLENISIQNFKGIAKANISFDNELTEICAENGMGKSSIKNAFEWLLCQNVIDVLPMLNNKEIPDLVTVVSANIVINDYTYEFERTSKGKYILNKDTGKRVKISNESGYKIDGLEYKEKDYKAKIADLLSNGVFENLQILTDKDYFNSDKFKWTDRRKVLFDMCGVQDAVHTIIEKPEYTTIKEYIVKGNATSDIKSMLRKNKTAYKDIQNKNNILIEQKLAENTEIEKIDFAELEEQLKIAKDKHSKMLTASKEENQSEQIKELHTKLVELTRQKALLENEDLARQGDMRKHIQDLYNECQNIKTQYTIEKDKISTIESKILTAVETECPTCHRPLPKEEIEKANDQIKETNAILLKQLDISNSKLQELKNQYEEIKAKFEAENEKFKNFKPNEQINETNNAILALQKTIEGSKDTDLNKLSTEQISSLESQISALERELAKKEYCEENKNRIQKWKDENKDIADVIIQIEQKETALEKYVKEQTDIIIDTVNSKFSNGISWALYKETYKNGEGGVEEDCVCMYNGKRYSSLSTGEKNITNIEIVKTLQDYYGVNITIMSDNSEANTIPFDSANRQVVEFKAIKGAKFDGIIKITDLYKGE